MLNPAIAITAFRLLFVLPTVYFALAGMLKIALVYVVFFVLLDIADGYVARKFNCKTTFGKHFDFSVDVFFGNALFFTLLFTGVIPWVFFGVLLVPTLIFTVGFFYGMKKRKGTFVSTDKPFWKLFHGGSFFVIIVCFLINTEIARTIAWFFLIPYTIGCVRYLVFVVRTTRMRR